MIGREHVIPNWLLSSFIGWSLITIGCILCAVVLENPVFAAIPAGIWIGIWAAIDFKRLFYLLLFFLPLSIEFNITPSLGTDLPTEPLMVGLFLILIFYTASRLHQLNADLLRSPIILALLAHLCWILITVVSSETPLISVKYLLAKSWYVGVFVFLGSWIIKDLPALKKAFWVIYLPLTAMVIQSLIRHGMRGFVFEDINEPVMPFFRNHVNYAAMITAFLPLLWHARSWYPKGSWTRRILWCSIPLFLTGIFFSYTRACLLATVALLPFIVIVRFRLLKYVFGFGLIGIAVLMIYLANGNQYLRFAPEFKKTIYHSELDDHMASTFEGQDVSSMERVYRWVAAVRMFEKHPWFGFGPNSFTTFYKQHTVYSFETYVSDNEEKSTVHNYFLLTLVEQGVPGMFFFLMLSIVIFLRGESLYFSETNPEQKQLILVYLCSFAVIYINLLLSDLVETDKIGSLYFLFMGLLARTDLVQKRKLLKNPDRE